MRKLQNWLEAYLLYNTETESAKQFHWWAGTYVIAAALRKKIWLPLGRINIYPNLYVVLVAEPGRAKKTQSLSFAREFLSELPDIRLSADAATMQAMLEDLEDAREESSLPSGQTLIHCSLNVISKELESFFGPKKENTRMLTFLTDIFDAEKLPFRYRTKHSGSSAAPAAFINLIAATTPESLANALPSTAVGGGLTSRIIFVWASKRSKKVTKPEETPEMKELRRSLISDLTAISAMSGEFNMSESCFKKWDEFYQKYEEDDPNRICVERSFSGWYARKCMYMLKVVISMSAARNSSKIIEWEDIIRAKEAIETAEYGMRYVFSGIGRSEISGDVAMVLKIVKNEKKILERELLKRVWGDIDARRLDDVMETACRTGMITKSRTQSGADYFIWTGKDEDWREPNE